MSIEEKYVYTTAEDSVLNKDWAAGSSAQIDTNEFVISHTNGKYTGEYKKIRYAPAWWKIIDEPIVNALDHVVRCQGTPTPVTCIKITFEPTGRVKIYNDGPGIEVALHKTASEKLMRDMYVPSFIFGTLFQGSNRERDGDSIIGGTNGLGAKLSNCFSSEFIVETVDAQRKLYFVQRWKDNKSVETPPMIIDLTTKHNLPADRTIAHTTLSFMPSYNLFGYDQFGADEYAALVDIVRTRAILAAIYAHSCGPLRVYFNDVEIKLTMCDVASILFPNCPQVVTTIAPTGKLTHIWDVCAVITDTSKFNMWQLSNVNGVVVQDGPHTKHILKQLTDGVKASIVKLFKDKDMTFSTNHITSKVFLLLNTKIPNPSWTGQRKDVLVYNIKQFAGYTLDNKFISSVGKLIHDMIVESIFNKEKKKSNRHKTDYEKYTPAKYAGKKQSLKCVLVPVEGDSAKTSVSLGISHHLGNDFYGILCLGGVIINARKECTMIETASGKHIKKSKKLTENIFMNVICEVVGLNPNYEYLPGSKTYKKEISELNYGTIAVCVDQDLDGKGNILGLLLNAFELFWPNLIKRGMIKWFCTPIIRAYPTAGGRVHEFYSVEAYKEWEETHPNYKAKYYKGLGTHSRDETIHMFKSFNEHLYTYYMDDNSHNLFEVYFCRESDGRKIQLAKPLQEISPDVFKQQEKTKQISCSDHLVYETDLYQRDNIERKLDHVIDGQNQSGRKILDGILKAFGKKNSAMKVASLAAEIARVENYHHGEDSLANSVTGKGFISTGGKQLPFIIPESQFGSRKAGGKDSAKPRYIWCTLNKRLTSLLFPECDYWLLPFHFDEGVRSEPKYFVPIIPLAIVESAELPAHGWKLKTWGRDVFKIIENVRRLIRLGDDVRLIPMPPNTYAGAPYAWKGTIKTIRGDQYSFGKYSLHDDTIHITELPLRVWTNTYVEMLKKKAKSPNNNIILDVIDSSDDITINIEIKLLPGAITLLDALGDACYTDGIEEYFQLRDRMDSHLNLIGVNNEVIMFNNYTDVVYIWFIQRKEYYAKRIQREEKLLSIRIIYLENIIRYIKICNELNLSKRKVSEMITLLTDENFARIHIGKLNQPKYTPTDGLEQVIFRGAKANYDYLLNLSDRRKSEESLEELNAELAKLLAKQQEPPLPGRFCGAGLWELELDQLEIVIREGLRTFWQYENATKFKFE